MPSKSGGKRATEKKHRERDAARMRAADLLGGDGDTDYNASCRERYKKLGKAPTGNPEKAHQWLSDMVLLAIEEAGQDPGLRPEARREQIGRLAAQAAKVIDPAKLSAKLAAYERALEELNAHAPQVGPGQDGSARSPSTLS